MLIGRLAAAVLFVLFSAAQASQATVLYSNGPVDGQDQSYTINFDYTVADSFTLGSNSTVTGADFAAWFYPGDFGLTVDWEILDNSPGAGGTALASGTAIQNNTFLFTNALGYDIYNESLLLTPTNLSAGTYWFELLNAVTSLAAPEFWDANGGPSQAYEQDLVPPPDSLGDITTCPSLSQPPSGRCSETFDITGAVPEPSTLTLFGAGLLALAGRYRRRRAKSSGKSSANEPALASGSSRN